MAAPVLGGGKRKERGVKENKPGPPVDRNSRVTGTQSTTKKKKKKNCVKGPSTE